MLKILSSKVASVGIINLKCITSPPVFLLRKYRCDVLERTRLSKFSIPVKTTRRFHGTQAVPKLYQQKDSTNVSVILYDDSECTSIKRDVKKIRDAFNCTSEEANRILQACPAIRQLTVKTILERFEYLEMLGILKSSITKYPWLLKMKPNELLSKMEAVKYLENEDVNDIMPILQASLDYLKFISSVEALDRNSSGNRIIYIAQHLKCPISEVCEFVLKFHFVYHIAFERLKEVLQTLIESNVASEYILADGWILRYNVGMIKQRVQEMKNAGVKEIKPWMLRSSMKNYRSKLKKAKASQNVLGEESVPEYLERRLECSKEYIKYLEQRNPKAIKVNIVKMHQILNILFEEGFSPRQIAVHLRVLENSVETVRTRLSELKRRGIRPHSLAMLVKSNKDFEFFLKKLDKHKKP